MMKRVCAFLIAVLLVAGALAGCGSSGDKVSVQSVSLITGVGSTTGVNRFGGVVTSSRTVKVDRYQDLSVAELMVGQGDHVTAGQVLFVYDVEGVQLAVDKLDLEIQQLEIEIASLEKSEAKAKERLDKANKNNRLEREIAWQELSIKLKEARYQLTGKQTELEDKQRMLVNTEVVSEIDGVVQSVNEEGGTDMNGNPLPYITIMEVGAYRVKGLISEMNSNTFFVGTPVLIRSRVDDSVWLGSIESIDWEHPQRDQSDMYYMPETSSSDIGGSASKYLFYIKLDSSEGLMLGQHVYIEAYFGQPLEEGLWLPACYIVDAEEDAYVWAADPDGKLEQRSLTLGEYSAEADMWLILKGLSAEDSIAYPDSSCEKGAPVEYYDESVFAGDDLPPGDEFIEGDFNDGEFYGEEGFEEYSDEMIDVDVSLG